MRCRQSWTMMPPSLRPSSYTMSRSRSNAFSNTTICQKWAGWEGVRRVYMCVPYARTELSADARKEEENFARACFQTSSCARSAVEVRS